MRSVICSVALTTALSATLVAPRAARAEDVDSDHLFSFNAGTDVGELGEKEIGTSVTGQFGRGAGSYAALAGELGFQYTAGANLVLGAAANGAYHAIDNIPDIAPLHRAAFGGLSFSATYRLLDREKRGFGLAVSAEPHWARVDETTGQPIDGYGVEATLAADTELIPSRVIAVFNLGIQPETARSRLDGTWSRENTVKIGSGVMVKVTDNVFAGVEARYLRSYETLGFAGFSGHAFFLGPSLSVALPKKSWLTVGWSSQIVGRNVEAGGALDLADFSRHEVRVAWGKQF